MKENFTYKTLDVDLKKKKKKLNSRLFTIFPEFFQDWKTGGEFQEFKTLYEPCVLETEVVSYFWLF